MRWRGREIERHGDDRRSMSRKDRFLRACKLKEVDRTPIWLMRQAGRYLPEYRRLREKHNLLTICKTPDLCAEATLLPVRKLGVDAAIIFADIMLPLEPMGISFRIEESLGPVIHNPISSLADIDALHSIKPKSDLWFVLEGIRLVRKKLEGNVPLIGFSGAPFTLASYIIEGKPSRDFTRTKEMMYADPETWHQLMKRLAHVVSSYLRAQIEAGVQAVQLFDSWVGCLGPQDYKEYVFPYSRQVFRYLSATNTPTIHFGTGTATLLELMKEAGGDVIGVDWRIPIDEAWKRLGDVGIQGNLDPAVLLASFEVITASAKDILQRASGRLGHIFNLGHGVLPNTPVENVIRLVKLVHGYKYE